MMRVKLLVLMLLVTACDAATIPPYGASDLYDFRLGTTPRSVLRWPTGSTVAVHVPGTDARSVQLRESLDRGVAVWNAHARYEQYRLERTDELARADVLLVWSDQPPPVETSGCEPQISRATTTFCLTDPDPSRARLRTYPLRAPATGESRVRMLVTVLSTQASFPQRLDQLVAHELGHVLGIAQHSGNDLDLMYSDPQRGDLSRRDAATIHVLYHTSPDLVP